MSGIMNALTFLEGIWVLIFLFGINKSKISFWMHPVESKTESGARVYSATRACEENVQPNEKQRSRKQKKTARISVQK